MCNIYKCKIVVFHMYPCVKPLLEYIPVHVKTDAEKWDTVLSRKSINTLQSMK